MLSLNFEHIPPLKECQREYSKSRSLVLRNVIDAEDVDKIYKKISKYQYSDDQYRPDEKVIGEFFKIEISNKLKFFLDKFITDDLINLLESITGKQNIVPHRLDLYSQKSCEKHYLDWHTDKEEESFTNLALCLPISHESAFKGAEFQLRCINSKRVFNSIQPKRGDIYLFDIDYDIEHRTSPIFEGERMSMTYFFKTGGRRFCQDD